MRSLRSRVIDGTNSSTTSTITNAEESSCAHEQGASKRKTRKVKTKKLRKQVSQDTDDEQAGRFVLLRSRKSVTAHEEDPKNRSTDSQRSETDAKRSAKRRKRKAKRSANAVDFCPTFEHAVTSTVVKPTKEEKMRNSSEANRSKAQKKKKQKSGENAVETGGNASTLFVMETLVSSPKHDTRFDANKTRESMNASAGEKNVTFDKTDREPETIANATFDAEMPRSGKKNVVLTNDSMEHATPDRLNSHPGNVRRSEASKGRKSPAKQACSGANNSTFDVDTSACYIVANGTQSRIDNGTFEVETSRHEANDGTFELSNKPASRQSSFLSNRPTRDADWTRMDTSDYPQLDDVTDVEIINISDDSPGKQSVSAEDTDETTASTVVRKSDGSVANQSGEWQVQLTAAKQNRVLNDTMDTLTSVGQSARKKWQKHARNSQAANAVLEQINSPLPIARTLQSARKSAVNPARVLKIVPSQRSSTPAANRGLPKNKSLLASASKQADSTTKGAGKRLAMPNFALIHQKAFDRMESLQEYSDRKRQRAKLLLSANKSQTNADKENGKKASVRQLFAANTARDHNRFGFKTRDVVPKQPSPRAKQKVPIAASNLPKPKLIVPASLTMQQVGLAGKREKPPVFERKDALAVANRNRGENGTNTRKNQRELLKGVRTNRRFELLMNMRKNL